MLTATQSKSIDAAEKYFSECLAVGDYFMVGQEIAGSFQGKGAELLGLEKGSQVSGEAFRNLLRGNHPRTGAQLAQRVRQDRRPGLDLTFSVPKSISTIYAVNNDPAILKAFQESVRETMKRDVEPLACRRVRDGKHAWSQHQKTTGNLTWSEFTHLTGRPVNGVPDCHLHMHCFIFNQTTDGEKHFALEPEQIFRQRYSLQAKFEARLARKLKYEHGYDVERVSYKQSGKLKQGWEIKGIERSTIEKFSRRTSQIETAAAEQGITDAKEKENLSLETREKKDPGLTMDELRKEWRSRLTPEELATFEKLRTRTLSEVSGEEESQLARKAIDYSLAHFLYRNSTVEKHTLVGTALEQALFLTPEQIEAALDRGDVLQANHEERGTERHLVTTMEVYQAEQRMIEFAKETRGTRQSIAHGEHEFSRGWLNDQQKGAVNHILHSRDTVIAITGGAGTGKSSLLEEAAEGIQKNGKKLFVFAPTTGAREVLVEKGFEHAETVEHLIRNEKLHRELKDQVIMIDEAALMDVRGMNAVFDIAKQQNARLVLSGDVKQHASPRRGEAYRILQEQAGLNAARIEKIQRQRGAYKRAVEMIGLGNEVIDQKSGLTGILAGYDMLVKLGKVIEIDGEERHEILAKQYLKQSNKKSSPLVISPSHAEGDTLTACIRSKLLESGAIGKRREFSIMRSLNLSEAQKGQVAVYESEGMVLEFHQNAKGFKRGERYRVCHDRQGRPALKALGKHRLLPLPTEHADRFEIYEERKIEFAKGDKIRFSLGGKAADGKRRISNGRVDEVVGFTKTGNLRLKSGITVAKNYAHWDHGYVLTSHSAQGKDAKLAMAAIGSQSLPAVSAKQLYVTASRGRQNTTIYVSDKEAVRRAIQDAGEQLSATEMIAGQKEKAKAIKLQQSTYRQLVMDRARQWWNSAFRSRGMNLSPEVVQGREPIGRPEHRPSPGMNRG